MDAPFARKHAFHMKEGTLGGVLEAARKAKRLSRAYIADKFKVSEQAVGQWERNETRPTNARIIALCRELEIDPYAAEEGRLVTKIDASRATAEATPPTEYPAPTGPNDVQVLGVAVGGDDGEFYFNGTIINVVARPPGIRNAAKVFATNITGSSMSPRFEPGELVFCQARPPAPGDDVIIELYPNEDGTPGKSFVKRFVRRSGGVLYCKQFNPSADVNFDLGEVKDVYRIIPVRELVGG